jgi:hypothetical protein
VSTDWSALTYELFDDAAPFPPARTPLDVALGAYRARGQQPSAHLVGPLVVRACDVPDLQPMFLPDDYVRLAVVADGGLAELAAAVDVLADDPWADVVRVEIAIPDGFDVAAATEAMLGELPFTVPAYLELPWRAPVGQLSEALALLAADGVERAKLRTGGLTPGSVPSPEVLAEFVHSAVTARVAFKLTAGLHHAVPNVEHSTGDRQHGFLNVCAATAAALDGGSVADTRALLQVTDAPPLLDVLAATDQVALRRTLRSIGSCSIEEPYDELVQLHVMEES